MSDYADNLRRSMINKTRRFMRMVQEMQEKDDAALREQVIRMAREAGFTLQRDERLFTEMLERFFLAAAAAGAEAEREACAKLCESIEQDPYEDRLYRSDFVDAIRARGEKK